MKLRNYQTQIINELREKLEHHRMILVQLATGGGKGFIIGHLAKLLTENKNSNWIISHRYEIHRQLIRHCIKNKVNAGQILSGQRMTNNICQVGMIQTIYRKLKYLDKIFPKLIQHDECHRGVARTNSTILNYNENTKIIGWTATPARTDGVGLNNAGYTCIIQSAQSYDLIQAGYLSPLVLLSSKTTELFKNKKFKIKNKDYDKNDVTIFAGEKRIIQDTIDVYRKYFNGQPAIIFCCSIEDCEIVSANMRANGWKCESVHDKVDRDTRIKYIDGLADGSINAVCAYNLLTEGVDIPVLAGCIIRRKTKSIILYLQMVGRTLRKSAGKKHAIVVDQAGNFIELGHPLLIREWILGGKCKLKSEDDLKIKQCPSCAAWIMQNVKICPYCNTELSKIKPNKADKIKIINSPLIKIKPPEIITGRFAVDLADVMECDESEIDNEIREQIKYINENKNDTHDRLEMIAKYFNKSRKWTEYIWDNFVNKT